MNTGPQIDIYQFDYGFDVAESRLHTYPDGVVGRRVNQVGPVTRSSLIRAQRMQLKLFDQMKGQSPDGKLEQL